MIELSKTVTLNNGVEMPRIGMGTAFIPLDKLEKAVTEAYDVGYRRFDTAWLYNNEKYIYNSLKMGGVDREDVFVTTKLHTRELYYFSEKPISIPKRSLTKAIEGHLRRLNTDYIDLLLIHWPFRQYRGLWESLLNYQARKPGIIRALGVSSWFEPHLQKVIDDTGIAPALNQFEINPYLTNESLIVSCEKMGVAVESYSSFGSQNASKILSDPGITEISHKYSKSPSQVILRWLVQRGILVVPRSASRQHLQENVNIYDFELTDEELSAISSLNRNSYSRYDPHYTLAWSK